MRIIYKFNNNSLGLAFLSIILGSCMHGENLRNQIINKPFASSKATRMVDAVYTKMTPKERVAQLYGIRPNKLIDINGNLSIDSCRKYIPDGIGQISQFACSLDKNPYQLRDFVTQLQHYLMTEVHCGVPAIFHEEAITGIAAKGATIYPQQLGVACTWNPQLAAVKTEQTAEAMRAIGCTMALSPMVDIIRTAHWNRIEESYGEDSYLSSCMALAFVEGLQKKGLENGVAACSKHFLGYGGGNLCGDKELMEEILMPHEAMIRCGGSKAVMTGYHSFRGQRTVASKELMQNLLRKRLGFDGIIVSDYSAVSYQWEQPSNEHFLQRGVDAFNAGNDLEFSDGISYPFLLEAKNRGLVKEERFEEAVKRSLMLKARVGLLNDTTKLYKKGILNLDKSAYRQTAYELACQSAVLLKNNGILPLRNQTKKIALVGPNANTFWCMLGDYTYQSMAAFWWGRKMDKHNPEIITVLDALHSKLPKNIAINYQRGCDWSAKDEVSIVKDGDGDPRTKRLNMMLTDSTDSTNWNAAIDAGRESDIIIAAVGENPTLCGEARSRKGICLPGNQEKFVRDLIATGKPVVLVIFGGRPQVITNLIDGCAAILQAWYPGEEGGDAVVDLLLGNTNPSGKLCISYPRTENEELICYNTSSKINKNVLFPFGYGLSYSTFEYSNMKVHNSIKTTGTSIKIAFDIKNTSQRNGAEIVQLYVSPADSIPLKPIQLKGFKRVKLSAGERKHISFYLSPQQLAYYDKGVWNIQPGNYFIKIGSSSQDIWLNKKIKLEGKLQQLYNRSVLFSICTSPEDSDFSKK